MPRINLANNLRSTEDFTGVLLSYDDAHIPNLRLDMRQVADHNLGQCYIDYKVAINKPTQVNKAQIDYAGYPYTDSHQVLTII